MIRSSCPHKELRNKCTTYYHLLLTTTNNRPSHSSKIGKCTCVGYCLQIETDSYIQTHISWSDWCKWGEMWNESPSILMRSCAIFYHTTFFVILTYVQKLCVDCRASGIYCYISYTYYGVAIHAIASHWRGFVVHTTAQRLCGAVKTYTFTSARMKDVVLPRLVESNVFRNRERNAVNVNAVEIRTEWTESESSIQPPTLEEMFYELNNQERRQSGIYRTCDDVSIDFSCVRTAQVW